MTETEKRQHRCCFTGHRPEKINMPVMVIQSRLEKEICRAIEDDLTVFIAGMARGVDIWAAETVLYLRNKEFPVRLICASPYEGFERNWSRDWQRRYNEILQSADYVRFISPNYSRACFQKRNEWMVNHSARVIAVYNGQPGGTRNTITYAHSVGVGVHTIEG